MRIPILLTAILISILVSGFLSVSTPATTYANNHTPQDQVCGQLGTFDDKACSTESTGILSGIVGSIINILTLVVTAVAAITVLIGGLRYATSNGDPNNIKKAKDTIIYSLVAIIIAASARGIVAFIVSAS